MAKKEARSRPVRLLLRRMFGYLGKFKRIVAIGAVFSLVATVVSIISPIVLQVGIDAALVESSTFQTIFQLTLLYVFLKTLSWILNSVNTWILADAQAGLVQKVQEDVFDHLVEADLSYHKSEQSGNVTSRVTTDVVSLATGIQVIIDFSAQVLMLVSTFIVLWLVAPLIALTSLVVVPGVILITALFGTVGQRIMLASQRAYGKVSGQIAENLSGIHVAKAFNRETELAKEMSELNQQAYHHGFKFMILMSALQPLVRGIGLFGVAAILFVGGSLAVGTLALLTPGQVFLGVLLVGRFMWPLLFLSMMFAQVQSSLAAMDRISDVLDSKRAIVDSPDAVPLKDESDGIIFDDVTFSYVDNVQVLKNVSFTVQPGELVAIVGHTGAGKTTIAALVNRFYDPDSGNIYIGNQSLREITLASLHDNVSLIPQEPYLFDGTIMENIRYGNPDASDEEIISLCKMIGANEFIEVLADGYDTLILESGKNLSAGQRQMITIARTMLANPKILILDEATSRLDAYSESLVQEAQSRLFAGRTTIVIAHRLTTIANASRIFVFDHGELIEEGTHEELLAQDGTFRALYETYYAHQGIEELTEEIADHARSEVSKIEQREIPSLGMGMSASMMGGMSPMGGFPDPKKMVEMLKKVPPDERGHMLEMMPPHIREKVIRYLNDE